MQAWDALQAEGVIPLGADMAVGLRLMENKLQSVSKQPSRP